MTQLDWPSRSTVRGPWMVPFLLWIRKLTQSIGVSGLGQTMPFFQRDPISEPPQDSAVKVQKRCQQDPDSQQKLPQTSSSQISVFLLLSVPWVESHKSLKWKVEWMATLHKPRGKKIHIDERGNWSNTKIYTETWCLVPMVRGRYREI